MIGNLIPLIHNFTAATGLAPNLLLISPDHDLAMNLPAQIYGMRVIVDDAAPRDLTVGYMLDPKNPPRL